MRQPHGRTCEHQEPKHESFVWSANLGRRSFVCRLRDGSAGTATIRGIGRVLAATATRRSAAAARLAPAARLARRAAAARLTRSTQVRPGQRRHDGRRADQRQRAASSDARKVVFGGTLAPGNSTQMISFGGAMRSYICTCQRIRRKDARALLIDMHQKGGTAQGR